MSQPEKYKFSLHPLREEDGEAWFIEARLTAEGKEYRVEGTPDNLQDLFSAAASRIQATWPKWTGNRDPGDNE